jgi:hypothetical protein
MADKIACIFESDELGHLCDLGDCPKDMDERRTCISACYTCMVEHYIKLLKQKAKHDKKIIRQGDKDDKKKQ